jgi:hypothetical protein
VACGSPEHFQPGSDAGLRSQDFETPIRPAIRRTQWAGSKVLCCELLIYKALDASQEGMAAPLYLPLRNCSITFSVIVFCNTGDESTVAVEVVP